MKRLWVAAGIAAGAVMLGIVPLAGANVPGVQITSRPANPTNATSATFEFVNSRDAGASFECQIDGSAFFPCLTPVTAATLADGPHTFAVRDALETSDGDSFSWTVRTAALPAPAISGPSGLTADATPTFAFIAATGASNFKCSIDAPTVPTATCPTPFTAPRLADGLHRLYVTASDPLGNTSDVATQSFTVDTAQPSTSTIYLTPPEAVQRVTARAGDRTVLLTWASPATARIASVRVERSAAGDPVSKTVYRGLRTSFRSTGLLNDVTYRFVLVAFDRAGNSSEPVVVSATPKAILLAAPKPGARVTGPPLLRWIPAAPAGYFNVQLYRDGTKILSAWPNDVRLQLAPRWSFGNHTFTLRPGVYTWYVWPGLGARADVRYGELLGRSSFVVVKAPGATR